MTSDIPSTILIKPDATIAKPAPSKRRYPARLILGTLAATTAIMLGQFWLAQIKQLPSEPVASQYPLPLVMRGGDPHIRALMRTISVAESNSERPYSILYGGDHFKDLSHHPDQCIPILNGPNLGDCTTAAGRYQFITTTWIEQAEQYHPKPSGFWFSRSFSFAPEYQDQVVYRWLSDPEAWGVDLTELLYQDRLEEVLQILSPTWTSLGYGIEPNSMTDLLPDIYQQLLSEEMEAEVQAKP